MPKSAFVIRMHYPDGPKFGWRYGFFVERVLPRIRKQHGDFDICVWCEGHHRELFEQLGCRPFEVLPEYLEHIEKENRDSAYFKDFVPWAAVVGMDRYDLQIGLDSDDLLLRVDVLESILKQVQKHAGTVHISFQSLFYDFLGGQYYTSRYKYSVEQGSPFFALWQPGVNDLDYVFAYEASHFNIGLRMDYSFFEPEGYWAQSVHGHNESSTLENRGDLICLAS